MNITITEETAKEIMRAIDGLILAAEPELDPNCHRRIAGRTAISNLTIAIFRANEKKFGPATVKL